MAEMVFGWGKGIVSHHQTHPTPLPPQTHTHCDLQPKYRIHHIQFGKLTASATPLKERSVSCNVSA